MACFMNYLTTVCIASADITAQGNNLFTAQSIRAFSLPRRFHVRALDPTVALLSQRNLKISFGVPLHGFGKIQCAKQIGICVDVRTQGHLPATREAGKIIKCQYLILDPHDSSSQQHHESICNVTSGPVTRRISRSAPASERMP
jgi:hypothetical protein